MCVILWRGYSVTKYLCTKHPQPQNVYTSAHIQTKAKIFVFVQLFMYVTNVYTVYLVYIILCGTESTQKEAGNESTNLWCCIL